MSEQPKILLVVEDDPYVRRIYQRLFTRTNYAVEEAADGTDGLRLAQEKHPDLVLLDLMLPGISGIDVLKKLKEQDATKDIPVLILSNIGEEEIRETAMKLGAAGYMVKIEFSPEQVLEEINKFFKKDQQTTV